MIASFLQPAKSVMLYLLICIGWVVSDDSQKDFPLLGEEKEEKEEKEELKPSTWLLNFAIMKDKTSIERSFHRDQSRSRT
jgi:hypothetical protein